jgi:poly(ribitol-phosphate) beta-N-acetylglucosaminyltransferase
VITPVTAPPQTSQPRVSVVVPVFNPGREIEACLASLARQSLPQSEYEIILVDDGSTDGTAERLDAVAAAAGNVRVIHLDPSGAPGRPRNVGLDAARGRYVYFVDADDEIAPTTLDRLSSEADRQRADVVLGKHASASLPRGQAMFVRNRSRMTLQSTPALLDSSLAPNKLFRVDFLRDAGIRFPEGWRLMEDQYVVLQAYFRARRISVLADQTYYYFRRREDGEHLSSQPLDPDADVEHLRAILDIVEAVSEPGPLRMRAIRRLYRVEILARLADAAYAELEPAYRHEVFTAAHRLARERIDPAIDEGLNAMARLRSTLLRAGREDELLELARRTAAVELVAAVERAWWHYGKLRIAFEAHLVDRGSGRALAVSDRGGRTVMDPVLTHGLVDEEMPIDEELAAVRGNVMVREADSAAEWVIPTQLSLAFRERTAPGGHAAGGPRLRVPIVRGEAYVDPRSVGPVGLPIDPGRWAVRLRLNLMGIDQRAMLTAADGSRRIALMPAILGDPPIVVEPSADAGLWLAISRPAAGGGAASSTEPQPAPAGGSRLSLVLPIASDVGLKPLQAELLLCRAEGVERLPAVARHRLGRLVIGGWPLPAVPGRVELRATVSGLEAEVGLGTGTITPGGDVRLERPAEDGGLAIAATAGWLMSRSVDHLRQAYERAFRRVLPLASRVLELAPRRLRSPLLNATRFLRR